MTIFGTRPGLRAPQSEPQASSSPSCAGITVGSFDRSKDAPNILLGRGGARQGPLLGLRGGGIGQQAKEQNTGTEFPGDFCHISKSNCPSLVGIGLRRKRLLGFKNIDVYALGFYVDKAAAQQALSKSRGSASSESSKDQLCEEILDASEVEKTIRIVVTSGMVNHDRFVSSLRDSLLPACQKAGDAESMPAFEQLFEGTDFKKGLELAFTSTKEGGLAAKIDNKDVGEVKSPQFSRAFFSLYLGKDPVSQDGKQNIRKGLSELLDSPESASQE